MALIMLTREMPVVYKMFAAPAKCPKCFVLGAKHSDHKKEFIDYNPDTKQFVRVVAQYGRYRCHKCLSTMSNLPMRSSAWSLRAKLQCVRIVVEGRLSYAAAAELLGREHGFTVGRSTLSNWCNEFDVAIKPSTRRTKVPVGRLPKLTEGGYFEGIRRGGPGNATRGHRGSPSG